jgi:DNA polymerase-1
LWWKVDLSQAEARVVAYLAEEERLIELFEKGGDVHTKNASWIFNKSMEEVTKDERERAKRGVHALNYGMGPNLFAMLFGCSVSEGKRLSAKYFDTFPKIRSWHLGIQSQLGKSKIMVGPLGQKRIFFARWGEQLFRQAYAWGPQSTIAHLLNRALVRFKEANPEVTVLLQVHDEFDWQAPANFDLEKVREAFDIPIQIKGKVCRIPIDIKCGSNWSELKKVEVKCT